MLLQFHSLQSQPTNSHKHPWDPPFFTVQGQENPKETVHRLSKPLIGDDGKIYACSEKYLFAFETNGSIAWSIPINYTCNIRFTPIRGSLGKIYLLAENQILEITPLHIGTSEPLVKVLFGPDRGAKGQGEIIGFSLSTLCLSLFVSAKNRDLVALKLGGQQLWNAGPMLQRSGFRQGCQKNETDCYFTSVPVVDQCEASIYISNNQGELYCLSVRNPYFKWIRDLSSFDKNYTITPGNNGRLYVTVPVRALILAVDAFNGNILWQRSLGPLSTAESVPVIDSNGWISIGSLDGFLYSFSPTGDLKRFLRATTLDSVIQVNPLLDCSGYAVYVSMVKVEGKVSRTMGENTYISATKPKSVVFTMLVPSTGAIYWSESGEGQLSSLLHQSDLQQFALDETILLAFIAGSKIGNPFPCRTIRQKLASSCSQAMPKHPRIYAGNERAILLFLLFQTTVLLILALLVRFCYVFWNKEKLQSHNLGGFLEKRRSLRLQKKELDRSITELKQKAAEEAASSDLIEQLGELVRGREYIERKLSTTYSFGRDGAASNSKSLLPLYNERTKSYSFHGSKKESVTIFHTLSDTSDDESISQIETYSASFEDKELKRKEKAKASEHMEDEEIYLEDDLIRDYTESEPIQVRLKERRKTVSEHGGSHRKLLQRRRALSSTN
ncbi:hypothetical protein RJ641_004548 [Dillenia turbinata]|uniref:Protein GAMETE EXPRESSED 3 n=1 Tax=Dillenia turbinata TaxID=194707 RepID=A0AAN8VEY0_9MAGN